MPVRCLPLLGPRGRALICAAFGIALLSASGFHGAAVAHPPSEHPPDDGGAFGYSPATAPQGGSFEAWGRCPPEGEHMQASLYLYKNGGHNGEHYGIRHEVAVRGDHTWAFEFEVPRTAPPGQYTVVSGCWIDDHGVGDYHSHPFEVRAASAPPPTTSTLVPAATARRPAAPPTEVPTAHAPPVNVSPTTTSVPLAPSTTSPSTTTTVPQLAAARRPDSAPVGGPAAAAAALVAMATVATTAVVRRRRS